MSKQQYTIDHTIQRIVQKQSKKKCANCSKVFLSKMLKYYTAYSMYKSLKALYVCLFVSVPVLAGTSLGGVGSVGVVLLVLGLSSFT